MTDNVNMQNLQQKFNAALEPDDRIVMAKYMLNNFEFLGIRATPRRELSKEFIKSTKDNSGQIILELANDLWNLPYREYQYVAIDMLLANHRKFVLDDLNELIDLVKQKSWWDSVDGLASVINKIIRRNISETNYISKYVLSWIANDNVWVKRVAILHQLGWKEFTNKEYLFSFALQNASHTDFFIRKAIGWSLRDYAKYAPFEVYSFVDNNKDQFSGLTYREATKHRK